LLSGEAKIYYAENELSVKHCSFPLFSFFANAKRWVRYAILFSLPYISVHVHHMNLEDSS